MPTELWLTDRSRIVKGLQHCQFARYLEYHSASGYGIRRKSESMPLVTGTHVHNAIAEILQAGIQELNEETRSTVRGIIGAQLGKYVKLCSDRGFLVQEEDQPEAAAVIKEQCALVEAAVWGWCMVQLPYLREHFKVLSIEEEELLVLDCTCGLGERIGTQEEHEARDCDGIGVMVRPDFIAERLADGSVGTHDLKTLKEDSKPWREQWEVNVQMVLQTLGAEKRVQKEVKHFYIWGVIKGSRSGDYNPETKRYDLGPKTQRTPLLYAYFRPADPPTFPKADWKFSWNYTDPKTGRGTNLKGKGYFRAPAFEQELDGRPEGWTNMEWWVEKFVPRDTLAEQFILVGPHQRPQFLIDEILVETVAEERDWKRKLWTVFTALEAANWNEQDPNYQRVLHEQIRRSWNCKKWNRDCEFKPVCFQDFSGKPEESGFYLLRRPHHQQEEEQAKRRGVVVTGEEEEGEQDE